MLGVSQHETTYTLSNHHIKAKSCTHTHWEMSIYALIMTKTERDTPQTQAYTTRLLITTYKQIGGRVDSFITMAINELWQGLLVSKLNLHLDYSSMVSIYKCLARGMTGHWHATNSL